MGRPRIHPLPGENNQNTDHPASRTEILDALAPYITSGPSGLIVRIGTKSISMKREGRNFEAPRNAPIDNLIDAAVELTGPLTEEEIRDAMQPYGSVHLIFTEDNVTLQNGKRKLLCSLDCSLAHVLQQAIELTAPRERFRPVLGAGGIEAAPGEIRT